MKNPCFNPSTGEDCPRRKPGCGAHCKEWAKYVMKRDGVYKQRFEDSETTAYEIDRVKSRKKKISKREKGYR